MTADRDDGSIVDVGTVLDEARFTGLPLLVSVMTTLALVFDGFDIQAIAFAGPALLAEWDIERSELAPILAAGLIGMGVGALGLGTLGDRYGRRRALIASMVIIAVTSLASAFTRDPLELAIVRFLTGVGLGGALPNATALMVEFAPLAVRNLVVAITVVGVPVGGMLGAAVAARLVPQFGWQSIFLVGAALPGLLALLAAVLLPESPRYLAVRSARHGELARLLNRVLRVERYEGREQYLVREHVTSGERPGVRTLFAPEFRRDTLALWLVFGTNVFSVYAFFNWTPIVLTTAGLPLAAALKGSLVFNLGGVFGALAGALLMSRYGSRAVLSGFALVASLSTFLIGHVPIDGEVAGGLTALYLAVLVAGACITSVQVQMYTVAAHTYPTACRATGVGWALAVARLGGVFSSFAGSVLLALGEGIAPFFSGIAAVLVLTLAGVLLIRRHLPPTA